MKSYEELVQEVQELREENDKLKQRLQISPYGDDKIDELEQALEFARFEIETLKKSKS